VRFGALSALTAVKFAVKYFLAFSWSMEQHLLRQDMLEVSELPAPRPPDHADRIHPDSSYPVIKVLPAGYENSKYQLRDDESCCENTSFNAKDSEFENTVGHPLHYDMIRPLCHPVHVECGVAL
jgi:hypothetical protein